MKRNLLGQRDLLFFDPWDALKSDEPGILRFRKGSAHGLTVDIYGTIGTSDLTGYPIIEDMEVCLGDSDITSGLPESWLQEIEDSVLEDYPDVPVKRGEL